MRLVAFERGDGSGAVGVLDGNRVLPVELDGADVARSAPSVLGLVARLAEVRTAVDRSGSSGTAWLGLDAVRLLAPLRPGKIVAIGMNYRDHALEQGMPVPEAPLIFAKFPSAVCGPGDAVELPAFVQQLDYEAELAVVIGTRARNVPVASALDHVAGYTCLNDVSARDLQFADGQWVRGKSLDSFAPIGPALVTPDEVGDAGALRIRCIVNDETLQDSSTAQLIFPVAELISYCSAMFTLEPGDMIATGTPPGVGAFRTPPRWLNAGDQVTVEIERVGSLTNPVVAAR